MPTKEKPYTNESQDGRRKIPSSEHETIQNLYKVDRLSMRQIARMYSVDKRLIQFIVYPERLKALQEHNKRIKHHSIHYDKDKRREYMRKYRAKKKRLGFME